MWILVVTLCVIFSLLYLLNRESSLYWKKRGIPCIPPTPLFTHGIFHSLLVTTNFIEEIYRRSENHDFIGFFQWRTPVLMIRSPVVINSILNKDFPCFSSTRKPTVSKESDVLSQHLLALNGDKWKSMRSKLTPAFSSGKLKNMYPLIDEQVESFIQFLDENVGKTLKLNELCSHHTVAVMLSCSFGVETKYSDSANDKVIRVAGAAFEAGFWKLLKDRLRLTYPTFFKLLKLDGNIKGHVSFCENFINEVIEHREKTGFSRPDFVEILRAMQMDDGSMHNSKILSQVYSFLVAGYETTATALSGALFELAKNPQIANKVRAEVENVVNHDGSLSYQSIAKMVFLDHVVKETLRMYPPAIYIPRVCTKTTTVTGTSLTVEAGTHVLIPVLSLHGDPYYFPYPDEFLPQRFSDSDRKISLPDFPYVPFGDGPRKCIGMRFALLDLKLVIAKVLLAFTVELSPDSRQSLELETYARTYKIKNKINLIFKRVSSSIEV